MTLSRSRPRIGITGPDQGGWPSWFCCSLLVRWAGGRPVRIRPKSPVPARELDGIILGGGADVDPARYREPILKVIRNENRLNRSSRLDFISGALIWIVRRLLSLDFTLAREDKARDELEFRLLEEASREGLPILGICRGAQLINVHRGGSLYQDLGNFYAETPQLRTVLPRKDVQVHRGTRLQALVGAGTLRVNSLHRQSVKRVGRELRVAAEEPNGVIQAIESVADPLLLGLQWHPEFLPFHAEHRVFFRELVHHAGLRLANRSG